MRCSVEDTSRAMRLGPPAGPPEGRRRVLVIRLAPSVPSTVAGGPEVRIRGTTESALRPRLHRGPDSSPETHDAVQSFLDSPLVRCRAQCLDRRRPAAISRIRAQTAGAA